MVGDSGEAIGLGISSESDPLPTKVAADDFFEGKSNLNVSSKQLGLRFQYEFIVAFEN